MPNPQKFTNWRFNPFTNVKNPIALTEEHTVQYFPEANLYGIQAHEGIVLENPSTVSLAFKETNSEGETTEVPLQEVPKSQAPSAGQFRVDYDAETFFGTSLIELNSSDLDKQVILRYKGTGAIVKNEYIFNQLSRIPTSLAVSGKTTLDSELEVSGLAKLLTNLLLPNSDIASDQQNKVLNYSQIQSLLFARNIEILTSSGTWTKPAHVERVLAIAIGGGAGIFFYKSGTGNVAGTRSGGSGEVKIAVIDVSDIESISYTVGAAGYPQDVPSVNFNTSLFVSGKHGGATHFTFTNSKSIEVGVNAAGGLGQVAGSAGFDPVDKAVGTSHKSVRHSVK